MVGPAIGKFPVIVVGALLCDGGRILLGLRSSHRRSCPDRWDVIGGHVEDGEEPLAALVRELDEEIGIAAPVARFFQTLTFDDAIDGATRLDLFVVDAWHGMPRIVDDEHSDLRWFTPAEAAALPDLAVAGYAAVFRALRH